MAEPTFSFISGQTATTVTIDKTLLDTVLTAAGYVYTPTATDGHEKIIAALLLGLLTQATRAMYDSNVDSSIFAERGTIARSTTKANVTDSPLYLLEQITFNFSARGINPDLY
jgi:hypothetical protein